MDGALRRVHGEGLSPLARGNHFFFQCGLLAGGPIPARAGQPASAGATEYIVKGLSPLARGNRQAT